VRDLLELRPAKPPALRGVPRVAPAERSMPRRSRLTPDQWAEARAMREAGASLSEVAARVGMDRAFVSRKAQAEQWGDGSDIGHLLRAKVTAKSHGIDTGVTVQKREKALESAASKLVAVIARHREEVHAARERLYAGLTAHKAAATRDEKQLAFEDLKAAKISAETLMLIQRMERISWGLDETGGTPEVVIERSYSPTPTDTAGGGHG
jgi:hypothetical protein